MLNAIPFTRDLVLVGGGHAHALVLKFWGMKSLPGVRLTVINPEPMAPYTGMLPGYIAGHYVREDLEIDLVKLCRHSGARLIFDKVVGIDRIRQEVILEGREPIAYDVASFDVGISTFLELPGYKNFGVGAKPFNTFVTKWDEFLQKVKQGQIAPDIAVIGGGFSGCELAMAMSFALRTVGAIPNISLIESAHNIAGSSNRVNQKILGAMQDLDITVKTGCRVYEICSDKVLLENHSPITAALCVCASGGVAHDWISKTDLPQNNGFIEIDSNLGIVGDDTLFAVGDCSVMAHAERPKAGVFAVRAAPILYHNIRVALSEGKRKNWYPQKHYLKLLSLGRQSAIAEKFGFSIMGPLMWRWKNRIDRLFMKKLTNLPVMSTPLPVGELATGTLEMLEQKPLCGGCGAKVGRGILSGALDTILQLREDVVMGVGDDAAVLRQANGSFQVITTDHLRNFIQDPAMMTRIAAVHALGDVWAMGAQPQVALISIIVPQMSVEMQRRTLSEITDVANEVLNAAGAQLVGGHTTMGAELTIGFTITGLKDSMPLTVSGAKSGDVLILTRPIGSGVIMAAEMHGEANGWDVTSTLNKMAEPQDTEANILGPVANAMTDVTGFGLAGHVQAICRASHLDAELWQEAIPIYHGARALSLSGVASVLMPENRLDAPVAGKEEELLYDPQTAGGLLAAVPEELSESICAALVANDRVGHVVGRLSKGSGSINLT